MSINFHLDFAIFCFLLLFNLATALEDNVDESHGNGRDDDSQQPSEYWTFHWANRGPKASRMAQRRRLITIGKYSERDGDKDMLVPTKLAVASSNPNLQSANWGWGVAPREQLGMQMDDQQQQWSSARIPAASFPSNAQQPGPFSADWAASSHSSPPILRPIIAPQPQAIAPMVSAAAAVGGHQHAIDRFDTNLDRFASGPPAGFASNRILLPPNFLERLSNGISQTKQNPGPTFGEQQQRQTESELMTNGGSPAAGGRPRTVILTNQRIPPAIPLGQEQNQQQKQLTGPPGGRSMIERTAIRLATVAGNQVPALPDFRHEDIRPATDGERLGPQWKYAGSTNEYREDTGKEFTRKEDRPKIPAHLGEVFEPKRMNALEGPVGRFIGAGISPPTGDARVFIGGRVNPTAAFGADRPMPAPIAVGGRIKPYVNAPEEITGSRWRNIDEYYNGMNGGDRGRGPNRYVKMDLLNE